MLLPVQFIGQFGNCGPPFGICIMLMDTLFVGLFDRDYRITRQVLKLCKDFLGHFPDTVLHEPGIFMRGENHSPFVSPLEELIDAAAHRVLDNTDDLLKVHMLVIISFNTEEPPSPLVVGSHGDCYEELVDLVLADIEFLQYAHCPLLHDILCAGAGSHARNLRADALSHDRGPERPPGDSTCMHLHYFLTGCVTDRGLALHHVLTAHEHFCPVRVFVAVEQFPCYNAAEFFNHVDIPVYRLLEYFIDYLEIPGKVGSFEAAGQIDEYIEIGNKNDWSFFVAIYFNEFFYVFDSDSGKIYTDVR